MKLVFCGTPLFAVPSLERLASARLAKLRPDAIIVVGYGRIIPPWMLELPPYGNINVHASLLPKYRGAAPIQWAIANGEKISGVTTMLLNEGLDTGDILLQKEMEVRPEDTAVTFAPRLAELGADLIVETLRGLEEKQITPVPQDPSMATLAPILKKEDGLVDFNRSAEEIHNRMRGFQPWPGAYTQFRGKNLQFVSSRPEDALAKLVPGELRVGDEKLFVGCGGGSVLELLQVQPEGKKIMTAREFINGYHPAAGERLV